MKNNLKALLGKEIRQLRIKAGLTIEELAFRSGVHYNYLGDIERGRRNPSLANLEKVARGLNIHVSELFPKTRATSHPEKQSMYDSVQPLLRLLEESPPDDRDYILSVAKSFAKRLRKRQRHPRSRHRS